jgi:hypothetical protein
MGRERIWKLLSAGIGMLCGLIARKLMWAGYQLVRKDAAIPSPFDPNNAGFFERRLTVGGRRWHWPRYGEGGERPYCYDWLGSRHGDLLPGRGRRSDSHLTSEFCRFTARKSKGFYEALSKAGRMPRGASFDRKWGSERTRCRTATDERSTTRRAEWRVRQ